MPDRFKNSRITKFLLIIHFTLLLAVSAAGADSTGTARLLMINCPDSTDVTVNDKITQPDIGGWITVPAGKVRIKILKDNISVFSSTIEFQKGIDKHIVIGCGIDCAHLVISSNPEGAQILIDGEDFGFTPYLNQYIKEGKHKLHLALAGYAPLEREIDLTAGKTEAVMIPLDRSQAWKDSIKQVQLKHKRAHQFVRKLIFGSVAAALAGAGIYYDFKAKTEISNADETAEAYDNTKSNFDTYKQEYRSYREQGKKFIDYRNIFLGAAGAGTFFFGLSFVF
jgi:hypothetical protein